MAAAGLNATQESAQAVLGNEEITHEPKCPFIMLAIMLIEKWSLNLTAYEKNIGGAAMHPLFFSFARNC